MLTDRLVVKLASRDTAGVVARVADALSDASVEEAAYHRDLSTGRFFTRQVVGSEPHPTRLPGLRERFAQLARELGPDTEWSIRDSGALPRAVILVSGELHCLHDLLGRAHLGELPMTVAGVVGNHPGAAGIAAAHDVPFHLVEFPASSDQQRDSRRTEAFKQVAEIVDAQDPDVIVLARFMQILPDYLCTTWEGRVINIHHSFLPSFVGAKPYHQAHARGVKMVGATCHYVTSELDAGPIIEQDVVRIRRGDTVRDIVRRGRDVERVVLARGLQWHLEGRVFINGDSTVVLD